MQILDMFPHGPLAELNNRLTEIFTRLDPSQPNPTLICLHNPKIRSTYQEIPELADREILCERYHPNVPIRYDLDTAPHAIRILKSRGTNILYAKIALFDTYSSMDAIIVRRGELFRLVRHIYRSAAKVVSQLESPILNDNLLQSVMNHSVLLLKSNDIEEYSVNLRRGIVLYGPPGNGKTMLCRWIKDYCSMNKISFASITASAIIESFSKNTLDKLFLHATVLFFDDIDISFFSRRGENAQISCALLSAMDGMNSSGKSIRIFSTNEDISEMDSAFRRPGRVDECFFIGNPTYDMRVAVIKRWHPNILKHIDIERLCHQTDGMSFAQIGAIKSLLVINHKLTGKWDIKKSLKDCKDYGTSWKDMRKSSGFQAEGIPYPMETPAMETPALTGNI